MADVVVTIKMMPQSPDENLDHIEKKATHLIKEFGGEVGRTERENIAFGLIAVKLIFVMDESLGSTEVLEEQIGKVAGVQSVEVTDVRRAIG